MQTVQVFLICNNPPRIGCVVLTVPIALLLLLSLGWRDPLLPRQYWRCAVGGPVGGCQSGVYIPLFQRGVHQQPLSEFAIGVTSMCIRRSSPLLDDEHREGGDLWECPLRCVRDTGVALGEMSVAYKVAKSYKVTGCFIFQYAVNTLVSIKRYASLRPTDMASYVGGSAGVIERWRQCDM